MFINRRLIRLIFLTKLLKYFQHLFIECGERRDLYHSRPLFNIFVLCPGLLGFSIQQCTYQTCHSRMRGRFVSAMSLYGKVRGINLRAQVFSPGLYLQILLAKKPKWAAHLYASSKYTSSGNWNWRWLCLCVLAEQEFITQAYSSIEIIHSTIVFQTLTQRGPCRDGEGGAHPRSLHFNDSFKKVNSAIYRRGFRGMHITAKKGHKISNYKYSLTSFS